ncbi:hypothetical protein V1264_003509 [Littorina saxatilis]|uniref:Apple domain-containing protein n=2 Tax=Littorina saxatilis TaxID=31220 RepID=A0AAN9G8N4_9CAEN
MGQLVWKTWKCNQEYAVVCEYEQGICTYEALLDKTMTSQANATARGYVNDVTTCWDLCLGLRVGDQECIAAVFNELRGDCEMFLGDQILEESSAAVSDDAGSTLLLRRCFSGE